MRRLLKRRSPRQPQSKPNALRPVGEDTSVDDLSDYSSLLAEPPAFLRFHENEGIGSDDLSSMHESIMDQPMRAENVATSTSELDRLLKISEDDEASMMDESMKMNSVLKERSTKRHKEIRHNLSPSHTLDSSLASQSDVNTIATTIPSGNVNRKECNPLSSLVYISLLMPTTPIYKSDEPSVQSNEAQASQEQMQYTDTHLPPSTHVIERSIRRHFQGIVQQSERNDLQVHSKRSLPVRVDDQSLLVSHDENVLHVVDGVVLSQLKEQDFPKALETYESLLRDLRRRESTPTLITPLLCRLSVVSLLAGMTKKALYYSEEILQRSWNDNQSALIARIQLGLTYFALGDFRNSLISWREAAYKVGTNTTVAALLWNNIACLQLYMGDALAAENALQESIALRKQTKGVPNQVLLNMATTLNNLAILKAMGQQYSEAIAHLEECLLLQESVLEDGNEVIMDTMTNLKLFSTSEAASSRSRRIDICVEEQLLTFDPYHSLWSEQGIFDEGLPLPKAFMGQNPLVDCIDLGSLVHQIGPYQLVRDTIMNSFSYLTRGQLTFEPAMQAGRFSIPIDVDGNEVIDAEFYLPYIYIQARQHLNRNEIEDVLELLKGTLQSHRNKYGTLHPLVAAALHNLGMVMLFTEKYTAALVYFQHAVSIRADTLGFEHPDVAMSLTKMGLIQAARKDFDNAIMTFSQVLRARRKTLGYSHPEVAKTLSNLACIHYECGGLLPASKALEESIEILRNSSFNGGALLQCALATVLSNFGFVLVKRRMFDDASRAYEEALNLRLEGGQTDSAILTLTQDNLAYAKASSGMTVEKPREDGRLVDIAKMIEPFLDNMRCS